MYPSFGGVAQNVQRAKRIDKKHVFERMLFLLATILQRSVDVVARTIHGTFYAVMDKKGVHPSHATVLHATVLHAIAAPVRRQ